MVYIYNGQLRSHRKNEILPLATTWTDLESIMRSAIIQMRKTNVIWRHLSVNSKTWHKWTSLRNRLGGCRAQTGGCQGGRGYETDEFWGSVQALSRVRFFVTPWTAAHQTSLSITNSRSPPTHVHQVSNAIQLSHPLLSPSPPALKLSQHQGLFQWVSSSHQLAKVLEFQLQHQSFQWTPRTDML